MSAARWLQKAVNTNNPNLSAALDAIPSKGRVGRDDYDSFIELFRRASREGNWVGPATRLLCMKRPGTFLCLDGKNRSRLCEAPGIVQSGMSYARYWDEIIERVRGRSGLVECPASAGRRELEIWMGRTAFFDAIYYKE